MKRFGSVVVFKPEVTKEQAREALQKIKEVIDWSYVNGEAPRVHEFDDKMGGPVWYTP